MEGTSGFGWTRATVSSHSLLLRYFAYNRDADVRMC